jgi:peptide/nickel transport system substrate-binding protein
MRTRPAVWLLFLGIAFFSVTGCRKDAPAPSDRKPVMVLTGTDVSTFDPQIPFEVESSYVLNNIFETLVDFDSSFHLSPRLAVRWTNPDDRTWRFYLNENARFSDGSMLKASDVAFSINRLKSLVHSDLQGFTEHIDSIQVVDVHTVEIKSSGPVSILNNLVFIPIMSEKQVREAGDGIGEKPMGTGPYRLVKWQKKKSIWLASNPYYQPRPEVQEVEFHISEDPEKVLDDILRLKPDLAMYIPFRKLDEFEKKKTNELHVVTSNGLAVEYVVFNIRPSAPDFKGKNPLSDVNFRRALAYATDRDSIIQSVLKGFGRPASQVIAPEIFGYNPEIKTPEVDLSKSRRLLAQTDYSPDVKIPVYTLEGGSYRLENSLINQWNKIGVKGTLRIWKDVAEMNRALNTGAFAVTIQGYTCTSGDASEFLTFSLHTLDEKNGYGRGNYAGYSNVDLDRIAESNLHVLSPRSRLQMLQRGMQIVAQDLPYLPLVISPDIYIVSDRIKWAPAVNGELKLGDISFRNL